jgi:hypothetical protein
MIAIDNVHGRLRQMENLKRFDVGEDVLKQRMHDCVEEDGWYIIFIEGLQYILGDGVNHDGRDGVKGNLEPPRESRHDNIDVWCGERLDGLPKSSSSVRDGDLDRLSNVFDGV